MTVVAEATTATPTAVVGMVGGGQLAQMTQQAAIALGVELHVLSPHASDPAVQAGAHHLPGSPDHLDDLLALAEETDVVTFDHEKVPNEYLRALVEAGHLVRPAPSAKLLAQDKSVARRVLGEAGFVVPDFVEVAAGDSASVGRFAVAHGWPVMVKAPSGGYDGRGVHEVAGPAELADTARLLASDRWLLEEKVAIATELAVLVARRPGGETVVYPVVETVQQDGICLELVMPARVPDAVAAEATALAVAIADAIDVTGILAVELFLTVEGRMVVNELAARPHNSGHATIDAAATSQFENHLRAVLDWPLGAASLLVPAAATVNLLGPLEPIDLARTARAALEDPTVHLHLYGKSYAPGRKLGHVTALADHPDDALLAARRAAATLLAS